MKMAPVQNPTYMLAPNWTFRPGGTIALGNIIADPFKPHIVLSEADPEWLPATAAVIEKDWRLGVGKNWRVTVGVWAGFLQTMGLSLGGEHGKSTKIEYTTDALETVHFEQALATRDIELRVRDPIVAALMRLDRGLLSKPVYMITGVKVAKNFRLTSETASRKGGNVSITGPADGVGAATVGGGTAVAVGDSKTYSFSAENVVFAYQLHKIMPKGWGRHKTIGISEFRSAAAFLGVDDASDEDEDDDVVEVEHQPFTVADLDDLDTRPAALREDTVGDTEGECVVLSFNSASAGGVFGS